MKISKVRDEAVSWNSLRWNSVWGWQDLNQGVDLSCPSTLAYLNKRQYYPEFPSLLLPISIEAWAGPNLSGAWGCYLPPKVEGLSSGKTKSLLL